MIVYVSVGGLRRVPSHINKVRGIGKAETAGRFTVRIGAIGRHADNV